MMLKQNIPNVLTLCNITCGVLSIFFSLHHDLLWAAYCVGLGALFDVLDGAVARWLHAYTAIGKDLDSLADIVTFGVAPAVFMHHRMYALHIEYWSYLPLLIPVFSAWRLAKFNHDTRQTDNFIGLPTPASAIFFTSWPLIAHFGNSTFQIWIDNKYVIIFSIVIICILMVSEIRLFSLKFKKDTYMVFIFLVHTILLFSWLFVNAIPLIIILYLLLSFSNTIRVKNDI